MHFVVRHVIKVNYIHLGVYVELIGQGQNYILKPNKYLPVHITIHPQCSFRARMKHDPDLQQHQSQVSRFAQRRISAVISIK
jgi:hypothetical protein